MEPALEHAPRELVEGLVREVARALNATAEPDDSPEATPSPEAETAWTAAWSISGVGSGQLYVRLSNQDAVALARQRAPVEPDAPEAVEAALRETLGQAAESLNRTLASAGVTVAIASIAQAAPAAGEDLFLAFRIPIAGGDPIRLAAGGRLGMTPAPPADRAATRPSHLNLDLILDIDMPLAIRFGETQMTLSQLSRLGIGSVVDLGRSPDDPVDVLINGRLIARGEVVVVLGNYGVRITEVISPADRIRTLAT